MKESLFLYQKVINHVICNACDMTSYGLLNGMLGVCLTLYKYSQDNQLPVLINYAEHLLQKCLDNINIDTPISFSNGLCGISWGIDYLIYNGYVTGDPIEIFKNIDFQIAKISPSRLDNSLEQGFKGLLHYILAHSKMAGYRKENFNSEFINDVHNAVRDKSLKKNDSEMTQLYLQFENWYKGNPSQYFVQPSHFVQISKTEITSENYMSYPICLSEGLSGFLIIN